MDTVSRRDSVDQSSNPPDFVQNTFLCTIPSGITERSFCFLDMCATDKACCQLDYEYFPFTAVPQTGLNPGIKIPGSR